MYELYITEAHYLNRTSEMIGRVVNREGDAMRQDAQPDSEHTPEAVSDRR
jgi:hypothetical protein